MSMKQETEAKGPDYHFLISLLPYIEELDTMEKLQLRCQIQALVTEAYKKSKERRVIVPQHEAPLPLASLPQSPLMPGSYELENNTCVCFLIPETYPPNSNSGNYTNL